MWKASDKLMATIKHYASFDDGVVDLPRLLAHRVEELNHLPDGLNEMPSIKKVKDWYAQSFEVNI